jgi:hypothetical protein
VYAAGTNANQHVNLLPKGTGGVGIRIAAPGAKLHVSGGKILLDGNQQVVFSDTDFSNNLKLQLWAGYGPGINPSTLFYKAYQAHSWRDGNSPCSAWSSSSCTCSSSSRRAPRAASPTACTPSSVSTSSAAPRRRTRRR